MRSLHHFKHITGNMYITLWLPLFLYDWPFMKVLMMFSPPPFPTPKIVKFIFKNRRKKGRFQLQILPPYNFYFQAQWILKFCAFYGKNGPKFSSYLLDVLSNKSLGLFEKLSSSFSFSNQVVSEWMHISFKRGELDKERDGVGDTEGEERRG